MKYYDKLIFDLSKAGRQGYSLPTRSWDATLADLPAGLRRAQAPALPEVSELDVVRHYTNLSQMNFGVDSGFYPLGSCTMKYNPKINEEIAAMPAFAGIHPLQPSETVQGVLRVYKELAHALSSITGMAEFTLRALVPAQQIQEALQMIGVFGAVEVEEGLVNFCVTEKVSKENIDAIVSYITSLPGAERRGNLLEE